MAKKPVPRKVFARKVDRLEMRLDPRHKRVIEEAAAISGQAVSAFATSALVERAEAVLAQQSAIVVARAEWRRLCRALDHPPKPNARLRALMRGDEIDDRALE